MIKALLTIGVCLVSSLAMAKSLDELKIHGNCNHQSTVNGTCTWGDGKLMRYAGEIDGRRLFVANSDEGVYQWGAYNAGSYFDVVGIDNYKANYQTKDTPLVAFKDLDGKKNQAAYMNECAGGAQCGTKSRRISAFERCGLKGMYLPSAGELNIISQNIGVSGGVVKNKSYWTSSESSLLDAWIFHGGYGLASMGKQYPARVRCVRSIID